MLHFRLKEIGLAVLVALERVLKKRVGADSSYDKEISLEFDLEAELIEGELEGPVKEPTEFKMELSELDDYSLTDTTGCFSVKCGYRRLKTVSFSSENTIRVFKVSKEHQAAQRQLFNFLCNRKLVRRHIRRVVRARRIKSLKPIPVHLQPSVPSSFCDTEIRDKLLLGVMIGFAAYEGFRCLRRCYASHVNELRR